MYRCFVRGRVLWLFSILTQLVLSSNVQHLIVGIKLWIDHTWLFKSSKRCMMAITFRSADEMSMYSASVVLSAIID